MENLRWCKFGIYKTLPIAKTQKNFYSYNLTIAPPYEYCTVDVQISATDMWHGVEVTKKTITFTVID